MGEICCYKAEEVGSIPTAATKLVRNSIGSEYRSFTPGVVSSTLTGPTKWMNSSTVERRLVKPLVKSSNLFSSADD